MKKLILTTTIILTSLVTFGQSKIQKIVKEFPSYQIVGTTAYASVTQIKTTDSLKRAGFIPVGVRASGKGTILVTFFKAVK